MLTKVGIGKLREAVGAAAAEYVGARGVEYTTDGGKPVDLLAHALCYLTGLDSLPWPESINAAAFDNPQVQAHLVVVFRLELTKDAVAYGRRVQDLTDDGMAWQEAVEV